MSTQQSIINYIADVWLDGDAEGLDAHLPIAELNIIDSAGIFDLVHYLQTDFRITVPLREISPANFRTVDSIAALVDRLRAAGRPEGEAVR
ncbi:acyl carrier protein [Streptomyces spectabilis]|uniref:Acyl carrier protein n=1 Tax=Streptomyces spectabilis TaxID=68270 RepID=A0A5P2XHR3_STRST|nr:acyl carrier protein [Streptomyces spectabilis]MBB5106947.1 acyl carrier protein [Streptomyces spectabilis]MCI3906323.1 acyl carrier protein [Streptomyces spectabilis]QEV63184.1 acyl carrier protein [Streptomyces spectabilis]GGV41412.1 acyl carrier protein [Streptomyces spectabilis]